MKDHFEDINAGYCAASGTEVVKELNDSLYYDGDITSVLFLLCLKTMDNTSAINCQTDTHQLIANKLFKHFGIE